MAASSCSPCKVRCETHKGSLKLMNNSWDWIVGYMTAIVASGNNEAESYVELIGAFGSAVAAIVAVIAAGISLYSIKIANKTSMTNEKFSLYNEGAAIVDLQKNFSYRSQRARLSLDLPENATPQDLSLFNSLVKEYENNESSSIEVIYGMRGFYEEISKVNRFEDLEAIKLKSVKFRMSIVGYELKLNTLVIKSKNSNFLSESFFI